MVMFDKENKKSLKMKKNMALESGVCSAWFQMKKKETGEWLKSLVQNKNET